MNLKNKVFIVTDAGQSIGRRTALTLAARGAAVVVVDVNDEYGQNVCRELINTYGRGLYVNCNISSANDCKRVVADAVMTFGVLNGVVNNIPITSTNKMKPFWELRDSEWDDLISIGLKGLWQMTKAALPSLLKAPNASIVNICYDTMLFGSFNYTHYVSSRPGIVGLSRAMARELGLSNVRVNSVLPGPIFTDVSCVTVTQEQRRITILNQCIKRPGTPQDIANTVAFLLSDESSFITGQSFNVDGGYAIN